MSQLLPILFVLGTVAVMLTLMRRRALKERFTLWWGVVCLVLVVLAIFPGLLTWASEKIGFVTPSNFAFFGGLLLLLVVSVQFSVEISRLEEKSRTLAEELAILRVEVECLRRGERWEMRGEPGGEPPAEP